MNTQPRPVLNASRTLGAISLLAGLFPVGAIAFGWVDGWGPDQFAAYGALSGGVISALALFLGVQVEKQVTPVDSPRDNLLRPLEPWNTTTDAPTAFDLDDSDAV